MSNHYHLLLKLCPEQLNDLTDEEIMNRWCAPFKGPLLVQRHRSGEALTPAERATAGDFVSVCRRKLRSISWFMRCLNQPIARRANLEDKCTGKFWESRFTSQALKTEEALLSCMVYVDLNPIRAGMASTPETSNYTSIQERIQPVFSLPHAIKNQLQSGDLLDFTSPLKPLSGFEDSVKQQQQSAVFFSYHDYLQLVDWTGRGSGSKLPGFESPSDFRKLQSLFTSDPFRSPCLNLSWQISMPGNRECMSFLILDAGTGYSCLPFSRI